MVQELSFRENVKHIHTHMHLDKKLKTCMYIYVHLFVFRALIDGQCYYWLQAVVCLLSVSDVNCQSNQVPFVFFLVAGCHVSVVGRRLLIVGVG